MIELVFNPGIVPLLLAFVLPFLPLALRNTLLLTVPLLIVLLLLVSTPVPVVSNFIGVDRHALDPASFGLFFAIAFAIALFAHNLFALKTASRLELSSAFVCGGSAIYATLCGDLLSLFVVCELMALGSAVIIFCAKTTASAYASLRYLLIHVFSGMLLLIGVVGIIVTTADSTLRPLDAQNLFYWFVLASLLINAGAPPFSALIADAYPEASPSGTVYLSAYTSKVAVFALLTLFAGEALLIPIGLYMIFYGIVYALGENDMRRILAYSIVNQVGFMLVGIGIGSKLAIYGAAMHAFAHILYKSLLMMSAGSVLLQTKRRLCTDLGGLFRSMHISCACGIVGALAISSFPLTSGFVSKSIIEYAALEQHLPWLWLALMAASAGVFLHAGIKFPWFVFFQKDSGLRVKDPAPSMCLAMVGVAALCLLFGIFPDLLYALHADTVPYVPYSAEHVVTKLELLLFSGAAFFAFLPLLRRKRKISLDWDWLYRKLLPQVFTSLRNKNARLYQTLESRFLKWSLALSNNAKIVQSSFQNSNTNSMAMGLMITLSVLLYFVLI